MNMRKRTRCQLCQIGYALLLQGHLNNDSCHQAVVSTTSDLRNPSAQAPPHGPSPVSPSCETDAYRLKEQCHGHAGVSRQHAHIQGG